MDGRELKIFNERTIEVQFLRDENRFLRGDRDWLRVELFHADQINSDLKDEARKLTEENLTLRQRVAELTEALRHAPAAEQAAAEGAETAPACNALDVKAGLPADRRRKKPGKTRRDILLCLDLPCRC
jgi:predicted nuclease with TOPRIM domain